MWQIIKPDIWLQKVTSTSHTVKKNKKKKRSQTRFIEALCRTQLDIRAVFKFGELLTN